MRLPILYSRRSDGKVQTWEIEVSGAKYRTTSGIQDGAMVTSEWTVAKGKSIGRSNETTPEAQAEAEVLAAWKKQVKKGYFEDLKEVDNKTFFEPMLAKKYQDYKARLIFPVYAQPKLDGMRCIARADGLWSRQGNPIVSAPHIHKALTAVFKKIPGLVLDGELYADKFKDNFNEIISIARTQDPTSEDLAKSAKELQYWIYDCSDQYQHPFSARHNTLKCVFDLLSSNVCNLLTTSLVENQEQLDEYYGEWLEAGYEGQIIRLDTPYENKRTYSLLKRKEFIDEEFEITDVVEGDGNRSGVAAKVWCVMKNGKTFKAAVNGNMSYCRRLLQNKKQAIGKMGTVKYFRLTPDGKPRFGKLKAIRDE